MHSIVKLQFLNFYRFARSKGLLKNESKRNPTWRFSETCFQNLLAQHPEGKNGSRALREMGLKQQTIRMSEETLGSQSALSNQELRKHYRQDQEF